MFYCFTNNNTKRVAWIISAILLLACLAWFIVFPLTKTEGEVNVKMRNIEYYALTTCVVELDKKNNVVTVEDSAGNHWQFCGVEDWEIGDCASLLMWDNGTESIFDDEIHSARYNAWTLTH